MPTIAYVACAGNNQVVLCDLDRGTGQLHLRSRVEVPGADQPSPTSLPLALSPDRRFLYAALRAEPFPISSFAIDPGTGALGLLGTARLAASVCYLATDRTGTCLFSASYGGSQLGVAPITGGIAGDTVQVVPTPPKAHCVCPDPENRFVYASSLGGDVILAQRFDGTRLDPTPHPVAHTRPGAGPRHLVFAAGGSRLYAVNELDGSIIRYHRSPDSGALQERQSIDALPRPGTASAADIHLTPDERFLYASQRSTDTLAAFRVDPESGALALAGHYPTEATPRGFAIDPQGGFLLCAGFSSGTVASYAIDPTSGGLHRINSIEVGPMPNWIEIVETA